MLDWLDNLFGFLNFLPDATPPALDMMAGQLAASGAQPVPNLAPTLEAFAAQGGLAPPGTPLATMSKPGSTLPAGEFGLDLGAFLQAQQQKTPLPLGTETGGAGQVAQGYGVQFPQANAYPGGMPQTSPGANPMALGDLLKAMQGLGVPEPDPSKTHPRPPGTTNIATAQKNTQPIVPGLLQAQAPALAAQTLPPQLSLAQMLNPLVRR